MNKEVKKRLEKAHEVFLKERKINLYLLTAGLFIVVMVVGIGVHNIGFSEGQSEVYRQLEESRVQNVENELMTQPIDVVKDTFWKYLMVKTMTWLPSIVFVLAIGWILHGVL